jgi:hypothetical protein
MAGDRNSRAPRKCCALQARSEDGHDSPHDLPLSFVLKYRARSGEHMLKTMTLARAGTRWSFRAAWIAGISVSAPSALAAPLRCPVRITGGGESWLHAASDLQHQLESMAGASQCSAIEVDVDQTGRLTLITSDGRRAERALAQPFELGPTVQALLVVLDANAAGDASPSGAPRQTEAPATRVATAETPSVGIDDRSPPPARIPSSVVLGASLGVRYGSGIASPTIGALGALRLRHWELGVMSNWEMAYKSVTVEGPSWSGAGLGAGIAVGRREPLGSNLDVLVGATVAAAVLHQETHPARHVELEATNAEGRVGAFIGMAAPARASLRVRAQLQADAAAIGPTERAIAADVPALPAWALGIQVGVEGDAL